MDLRTDEKARAEVEAWLKEAETLQDSLTGNEYRLGEIANLLTDERARVFGETAREVFLRRLPKIPLRDLYRWAGVAANYTKADADLVGMVKLDVLIGYDKARYGFVRRGNPVTNLLVEVWIPAERRVVTKRVPDCSLDELEEARKHALHPEPDLPPQAPAPLPAPVPADQQKAELSRKWLWVFAAGVAFWLAGWILPGKAGDGANGLGELAMLFAAIALGVQFYRNIDAWKQWTDDGSGDAWEKAEEAKLREFWMKHRVPIVAAVVVFLALAAGKRVMEWRAERSQLAHPSTALGVNGNP